MIQLGNRVGSHDTAGKQGEITLYKWETGWDLMIQDAGKMVGSHDTSGRENGGIT